jgi:hypothetical protein
MFLIFEHRRKRKIVKKKDLENSKLAESLLTEASLYLDEGIERHLDNGFLAQKLRGRSFVVCWTRSAEHEMW